MSTSTPDFNGVMAEIGEFVYAAVEGLDAGTAHARSYYEGRRSQIEPPLASMLTRSMAKEYIREKCGLTVQEFEQEDVALIGLRAKVERYHVWIWKSFDEKIPNPGPSLLKRLFLDQVQLPFELEGLSPPQFNLALIWNTTEEYVLTDTFLALPKSSPKTVLTPTDVYWCRPIPHVETRITSVETAHHDFGGQVAYEPLDDTDDSREEAYGTDQRQ